MSTSSDILGMRIGAYEVQAILGSGGMATVYRGFDHNLHRPVAIKVLSDAAAQPDFVERFRQEARLIARLRHPNIVRVYDLVEQDGVIYMIQELLAGQTLAARLSALTTNQEFMPRQEIIAVMQQLAAALDAAHLAGIIHRDVKPSNILYNDDGVLVLTDFGIAKSTVSDTTKTQTGMVLGTPAYISPEQARGEAITPASDIYALGVVLYILITGQPPFDGVTPLEIVIKHLNQPPPLLQPLRAHVPHRVDTVVQRALAKRSEERFSTASELVQALIMAWPATGLVTPADSVVIAPMVKPPTAVPISVSPTQSRALQQPSGRVLPFLSVLVVMLLVGVMMAMRGQEGIAAQSPALPVATLRASAPLAQMREILSDSADPAMQTSLQTVEQALLANDKPGAIQELGVLQRQILAARQKGALTAQTMRAALAAVHEIALRHELRLPFQIERSL